MLVGDFLLISSELIAINLFALIHPDDVNVSFQQMIDLNFRLCLMSIAPSWKIMKEFIISCVGTHRGLKYEQPAMRTV